MSERILSALMQLFAIIAQVDDSIEAGEESSITSSKGRRIIESFLRTELSSQLIEHYLLLFDEHLNTLHSKQKKKDADKKRNSLNSVKVLKICSAINEELRQKQKLIVLIRIFEFINSNEKIQDQELEFVTTVAEAFNISKEEFDLISAFVFNNIPFLEKTENCITVSSKRTQKERKIQLNGLDDEIVILYIESVNILFLKYFGTDTLSLNGQFVPNDRTYIFTQGSTLHTSKSKHLYYSDVISQFRKHGQKKKIVFSVNNITYFFERKRQGLHNFSFSEESGKLLGIMGGSGTGKSTLLNILNGQTSPSSGSVCINGIDIHKDNHKLQGIIGFVSQDDLLIEELTVFQNLYFNAKLCFGTLSEREIKKKVIDTLRSVGLYEIKDLAVGSSLEKVVSGGQRKRLNIALELIREPEVLIVDEPTSGLSSRDSENIMDLLKEMTYNGKLIFVVIHQPSSDIFKMFDRLFIIDQGGYPIYDGNPIEAITYFKHTTHQGNASESECALCGNVNPEQVFNIVETRIVDEYGNLTDSRKIHPKEWYEKYLKLKTKSIKAGDNPIPIPQSKLASRINQLAIFFSRDALSKLSNRQYLLITFLEAPILGVMLSFFVKYFASNDGTKVSYTFFQNENLPQYIFISVIVALFLGITVAAEEIHKDKKLLQRESFLHLSRTSYLFSKILLLFIVSGIQTLLFVLLGNYILEIKGLFWQYWIILFSASCTANLLGLNISSAFNSAKVIYIVVPILIIPQLLFSGVIVKFDKLHPTISKSNSVPWVGNIMLSRWAYEALAVGQFKENKMEKRYFELNIKKYRAQWKKDYWIPEMESLNNNLISTSSTGEQKTKSREVLRKEINKELNHWNNLNCKACLSDLRKNKNTTKTNLEIQNFLNILNFQYISDYNKANDLIERLKIAEGKKFNDDKLNFGNEALNDLLTNRLESEKIVIFKDELIRKENPVYNPSDHALFLNAHFYSPSKMLFGFRIDTFIINIIVLWFFSLILYLLLYIDALKKLLNYLNTFREKTQKKPTE
ncbi:MAG: ATP-binding cassette domain-containing protein [Flavobacteriia bacterium]|jgi:ABC-type multidrug transport system ATPase subunit